MKVKERTSVMRTVRTMLVIVFLVATSGCEDSGSTAVVPFVPNSFDFWENPANWTTPFGPAYADILLENSNFIECRGGPIALCYYSGPDPAKCVVTDDGRFANCDCFVIPFGPYYVDINSILNHDVYLDTVDTCMADGSACSGNAKRKINKAPVCTAINQGTLLPGADMISTFSLACAPEDGIGQTSCENALYAGCMTASCAQTDDDEIANCQCPTYVGA
jgi:hypothetical protein